MSANVRINNLRDLLYRPPERSVWLEICRTIHDWPRGDDLDVAMDYSKQLLDRWPDDARKALGSWFNTSAEGYNRLWPLVRSLEFYFEGLQDQGAMALAASKRLRHITHLSLPLNNIGPDGAMALARSPHLGRLRWLDLSVNEIDDDSALELLRSPMMKHLTSLNLQKNRLSEHGASALARCPELSRLTALHLAGNPIAESGRQALKNSPHLTPKARESLFKRV